jgi:hypothetical protein
MGPPVNGIANQRHPHLVVEDAVFGLVVPAHLNIQHRLDQPQYESDI